jgi:hypothetical protein
VALQSVSIWQRWPESAPYSTLIMSLRNLV